MSNPYPLSPLCVGMRPSLLLLFWLAASVVWGQQRAPVVLIDGYHLLCKSENLTSPHDFGELEQRLQSEGVQVYFFGTCSFKNKPSIEYLATALGNTIRRLNVPEVDLVSYSMGGLIVRAFLSGKQEMPGVFTPFLDTYVHKWVSIATPNFGALLPDIVAGYVPDQQAQELVPGNQFLFDLATWNQNHDDLRGVDTIGIIGNAGGSWPFKGQSDGTVAVTSASMSFALPDERTRVLPYCHGAGDLTAILGLGCDAPPVARIQSDNPLTWNIIDSFFKGTSDWQSVGHSPSQDGILSRYGGVLRQSRNDVDQPIGPIQDQTFVANPPRMGGYSVVIDKPGPRIASIAPSQTTGLPNNLAPGMRIAIYGYNLGESTVTVNGEILALNGSGSNQLNALLPETVSGLVKLTVTNNQGLQTVNIFAIAEPTFTGSVAHLAAAGTWDTIFYLVATGQESAQVRFSQFGDSGNPLSTTLNFPQQTGSSASLQASSIDRTISQNSMLIVDSTGLDSQPVQTGWARLAAAGKVEGFAIFRVKGSGREATVPLETRNANSYLLAFDNTGGVATGVAINNVSTRAANVVVTLRDETGAQMGSDSILLAGNGHSAFVLANQYPVTANIRGSMEIFTPLAGQLSLLGVRSTPTGTMATIPVVTNATASTSSLMTYLTVGGGWKTSMVLINAGTASAQAHLRIIDNAGNPLFLPFSFPGGETSTAGSSLNRTLAAKQMLVIESAASINSPLQTGSVQLTTDGSVSGFWILRYEPSGQEAVMPVENRSASAYLLAFDHTAGMNTGIVVSSVSAGSVTIPVIIRDDTGVQIATGLIPLASNGHGAFVLASRFPVTAGIRGTMEFDTPLGGQIGVLGIRASSTQTFTALPTLMK